MVYLCGGNSSVRQHVKAVVCGQERKKAEQGKKAQADIPLLWALSPAGQAAPL